MPAKKYLLPLLLLVQFVMLQILSFFPDFVERYYSNGIYPVISRFSRLFFGWIPISIGDVAYIVLIGYIIYSVWKSRKKWRSHWKDFGLKVLGYISILYFLFNILWGINYLRVPLSEKMNIGDEYTDEQMLQFTYRIIEKTNLLHEKISGADSLKVKFPYTQNEVFIRNLEGYQRLGRQYQYFQYEEPSVKKSIISLPLTYMGFSGYLNPFTNEAQVNDMLPSYSFPVTTCHEMAHQLGYASESEANFIGYLAAISSDDPYIQYSGYTLALKYCLGNWEARNEKTFEQLLKKVNPGIINNFKESKRFWEQYESFIETGFHMFYDNFLKINQQDEGLESYSRFVDLLVNYYIDREL